MPCLHPRPKDLRIPDWERQDDVVIVLCSECGKVMEIRFCSQSADIPHRPMLLEAAVETAY